jgi:hypothetical protein
MPRESFWNPAKVEGDPPDLTVAWGWEKPGAPEVMVNDMPMDRSGLNRLIGTLRRARNQVYGADE